MCSASWSVIEVNGVQCFTSSSLSFSGEQLSSKEKRKKKKISWINPVPLASFNTGAVEDVCAVLLRIGGILSGGLTGGLYVC